LIDDSTTLPSLLSAFEVIQLTQPGRRPEAATTRKYIVTPPTAEPALPAKASALHCHKLSQLKPAPFLKSSRFAGTCRTPI